ncbi:MAG: hypothetical protein JSW71_13250 [Gemmatimonadota bacterium]|nr:MAG: hypothetical protein JSW71_13250 [Gemmatimonadota bacterium]
MIERELGLEAELVDGHYGEFTVLVDDQPVVRGGALTRLGIVPRLRRVRETLERTIALETPTSQSSRRQ